MPQLTRRQVFAAFAAPLSAAGEKPNFVIISIDDLGYADVSPFGKISYTPNIERMAREGMRLECCYAQPVCTPSRAALMTGCYPRRVGLERGSWHGVLFPGDRHGLNPREITIARLLKKQGYATACIGKWHLGDQPEFLPTRHGFDSYLGIPYSNDMGRGVKNPQAQNPCPPLPLVRNDKVVREVTDQDVLTPEYTAEAVAFIRKNKGRPFFLYLPHNQVHGPLFAAKSMRGKRESLYQDAVADSDWSVGEVLRTLEQEGLGKKTLVIFTSDNGGTIRADNKPFRGNKGSVWEGGLRTPTIAWWPGRIPAGTVSRELTSHIDFLPTLAKLAGAAPPSGRKIDGHDLSPILFGGPGVKTPWEAFYFYQNRNLRAVRAGAWKYHVSGELYNLDSDIGESKDVAAANPDQVARMKSLIARALADLGEGDTPGPGCRPVGRAKGPLRFFLPHDPATGLAPHAPVKAVG
ncbi:MAG: sulfatase [Acidobacteria bacterium]|nr:sulfatase [Acidobacteriota bacterium]